MPDTLRVLLLEDNREDAVLVERELRKEHPGCELRRAEGRDDFLELLRAFEPHLILSDHRLARFSGLD
ncbi:MAG TPA: hypothetical protein VF178_13170, partial [Gemmatimonadaceae bacterium]